MTALRVILTVLAAWFAVVWHASFAGQTALLGQKPDLGLLVIGLVGLRSRPGIGALCGFLIGALEGGVAGANLTALAASRALLAFACSWVGRTGLQLTPWVTAIVVALGTVAAQALLLLMAPPADIGSFLGATLGTAIYNGVFAAFLDALLRRTLDPRTD